VLFKLPTFSSSSRLLTLYALRDRIGIGFWMLRVVVDKYTVLTWCSKKQSFNTCSCRFVVWYFLIFGRIRHLLNSQNRISLRIEHLSSYSTSRDYHHTERVQKKKENLKVRSIRFQIRLWLKIKNILESIFFFKVNFCAGWSNLIWAVAYQMSTTNVTNVD